MVNKNNKAKRIDLHALCVLARRQKSLHHLGPVFLLWAVPPAGGPTTPLGCHLPGATASSPPTVTARARHVLCDDHRRAGAVVACLSEAAHGLSAR